MEDAIAFHLDGLREEGLANSPAAFDLRPTWIFLAMCFAKIQSSVRIVTPEVQTAVGTKVRPSRQRVATVAPLSADERYGAVIRRSIPFGIINRLRIRCGSAGDGPVGRLRPLLMRIERS